MYQVRGWVPWALAASGSLPTVEVQGEEALPSVKPRAPLIAISRKTMNMGQF